MTHVWLSVSGTVVLSNILFQDAAGPHTVFAGTGFLSGLDLVVPAGETVTITGTGGAVGYTEAAIG